MTAGANLQKLSTALCSNQRGCEWHLDFCAFGFKIPANVRHALTISKAAGPAIECAWHAYCDLPSYSKQNNHAFSRLSAKCLDVTNGDSMVACSLLVGAQACIK